MNSLDAQNFEKRKQDHIELAMRAKNQTCSSDLERLELVHEAIPDLDFVMLDIGVNSLGRKLTTPFFISSMTAGHRDAININARLAEAAAATGWAMGVGSQRRELTDDASALEWKAILKNYPNLELYGNIGIAQVITTEFDRIKQLCDNLHAKALFIHCNPLQECIQPEGTPQFSGAYHAIEKVCKSLKIPVIIKETGCGFSANTLARLNDLGITAVDVSGFGGTHWGRIEGDRAHTSIQKQTAESFNNWGISTLASILNAKSLNFKPAIWASGGVRSGLDAAKYLAIGANRVGIAKPMLEAALISVENIIETMQSFEYQLKTALFCTGSLNINALREKHRWKLTP